MADTWAWRKSSRSGAAGNECVEIAWTGKTVLIRDSARTRGAVLAVGPDTWVAFLSSVDRPAARDMTSARP
ncbi:DUF397 domain-containing protein [Streptomyces sp. NPDC058308]|uniref:DUF397 domain-containing protein n=1 Tax=Streptomyces sp. NPDC058308 TaxID=3346440 RepID=UPI0036E05DFE